MKPEDDNAYWNWAIRYVYGGLTPEQEREYEKMLGITRKDLEPTYEIIWPPPDQDKECFPP